MNSDLELRTVANWLSFSVRTVKEIHSRSSGGRQIICGNGQTFSMVGIESTKSANPDVATVEVSDFVKLIML